MTNINSIAFGAIGALILTCIFLVVPMIGEGIDNSWTAAPQAKATGTLTFTDQPVEADTFNISTDCYEFDVNGDGVGAGYFDVNTGGSLAATLASAMACVNANDTTGVACVNTSTTLVFTADAYGAAGNLITTTDSSANASFGAATLTGGLDGSQWNSTVNTDLTTGAGFWTDVTAVLVVAALALAVGLFIIRPLVRDLT